MLKVRTLNETSAGGIGIMLLSSMGIALLILNTNSEVAPRIWGVLLLAVLAVVLLWALSRSDSFGLERIDQLMWAVLLSHTVLVARFRDTRILGLDQSLTSEIAVEVAIWCFCILYTGARFVKYPDRLGNLFRSGSKYATMFFVAALVSASYAASPLITLAWCLKLFSILMLACVLFDPRRPKESTHRFVTATYLGLTLMLVELLFVGALSPEAAIDYSRTSGIWRAGGFLLSPTQLSAVAGMVSVLLIVDALSGRITRLGRFTLVMALSLMVASLGRAGMLATCFSTALALVCFRKIRFAAMIGLAFAVALLALPSLMDLSWGILSRGQNSENLASLTGRVPLWEQSLELILQKPILGWGYVSGSRTLFLNIFGWWAPPHTHNVFLEMLMGLGLTGLTILCGLIWKVMSNSVAFLRSAWNFENPGDTPLDALKVLLLVVFLLVDGFFTSGFSGKPYFETVVLIGAVFSADCFRQLNQRALSTAPMP